MEETELLRAYHERGDTSARDKLVEANLPLARAIARRYAGRGEQLDDLVQVASIGLIKAIDRFDLERGVFFRRTRSRRSSARSSATSATAPGRCTCRGGSRS